MQAITYSHYGPPEVLQLNEVPKPEPGDGDLLVRVRATEATKADCEMRAFRFGVKWFWLPMRLALGIRRPRHPVPGAYFAGEVEAVGGSVQGFRPGDRVFGSTGLRRGTYAEYLRLSARAALAPMPAGMTFAEAAAVPLGGLNALHFLRLAAVRPGDEVLINGAGGSIGAYGVQIARAMGARVTAVDRGDKEDGLRRLGADAFIDYTRRDFTRDGARYDVVFDMVPGSAYSRVIAVLKPDGRYLSGNPRIATMLRCVLTTRFSGRSARFRFAPEDRDSLAALSAMIEAGRIGSIVDTVYPLAEAVEAHRRVDAEQRVGAIVLDVGAGANGTAESAPPPR